LVLADFLFIFKNLSAVFRAGQGKTLKYSKGRLRIGFESSPKRLFFEIEKLFILTRVSKKQRKNKNKKAFVLNAFLLFVFF